MLWPYMVLMIIQFKLTRSGSLRVVGGYEVNATEYPYIISIQEGKDKIFVGSGILVTPIWVLTAAHVLQDKKASSVFVEYGPRQHTEKIRKFRRLKNIFIHPLNYLRDYSNDIALAQIKRTDVAQYARLSSVDYTTLIGLSVNFAGYGDTSFHGDENDDSDYRVLKFGEGGIIPCDDYNSLWNPSICVVPKCDDLWNFPHYGDSGGPLFYENRVIGVLMGSAGSLIREERDPVNEYTPVSLYLDWIYKVTRSQANVDIERKDTADETVILTSDKNTSNGKRKLRTKVIMKSK